jgi:Domain of unknown function (DUF5134)
MVGPLSLRWLLTAVFVAAALGSLPVRWRSRRRHPRRDLDNANFPKSRADRVSDVFCALMCAALIAMTWRSGPLVPQWFQIAVFGCAVIWFGGASLGGSARSRTRGLPGLHHALMAGAMIWMIAAMPAVMPMAAAGPAPGAMSAMSRRATPAAVLIIGVLLTAYFGLAAIPWLLRAVGPGRRVTGRVAASNAAMSAGMAALLLAML